MAFLGSGFNASEPENNSPLSAGASWIRDIKARLKEFLAVSFDLNTGVLKASAVPNGLPLPYGSAGTVLESNGPGTTPIWGAALGTPIGAMVMWTAAAPPAGWLDCDGSTVLIAAYPALAAVIGTTFGGDGETTVGLPDLRGRNPVGVGTGDAADATTWTLAQKRGTEGHTLTIAQMPAHTHDSLAFEGSSADNGDSGSLIETNPGESNGTQTQAGATIGTQGGGTAHPNLQPSMGLHFIIRAT